MTSRDVRAGGAFVEVYARDESLGRSLTKAQNKLKKFGSHVQNMGRNLMGAGLLAGSVFVPALKTLAEFEDRMASVKAVTGATGQEFESLTEKAKELGKTTSFSAIQVAEGMKFLGMAGLNTKQVLESIGPVLKLARAGELELARASDIATDTMSAFNLTAKDLVRVVDVMAATATRSNTSIEMMGETFKYAAPLANAAGQSIEETSAIIATLADSGIKASVAGTDVANMFKRLANSDVASRLKDIGVETADSAGNMRKFSDVIVDLERETAKLTQKDRLALMSKLFGRSAKSVAVLTQQKDKLKRFSKELLNVEGAASKMAAVMEDTLKGKFRLAMSAAEAAMIELGTAARPAFIPVIEGATEAMVAIADFAKGNPELVQSLAGISMQAIVLGGGLIALGATIRALVSTFATLRMASSTLTSGVFTNLIVSIKTIGASFSKIGQTLPANFIGPVEKATVSTRLLTFSTGALQTALAALQIGVSLLGTAFIGFQIGKFLRQFVIGKDFIAEFNRQLRETDRLTKKMNDLQSIKHRRTLKESSFISDPEERKSFLKQELARAEKTTSAKSSGVASQKKVVDGYSSYRERVSDKQLALDKKILEERREAVELAKKWEETLREEIHTAELIVKSEQKRKEKIQEAIPEAASAKFIDPKIPEVLKAKAKQGVAEMESKVQKKSKSGISESGSSTVLSELKRIKTAIDMSNDWLRKIEDKEANF